MQVPVACQSMGLPCCMCKESRVCNKEERKRWSTIAITQSRSDSGFHSESALTSIAGLACAQR